MQGLLLQTAGIAILGMSEHVPACLSTYQDVQAHTSMSQHIPAYFVDLQSMFGQVFFHTQRRDDTEVTLKRNPHTECASAGIVHADLPMTLLLHDCDS